MDQLHGQQFRRSSGKGGPPAHAPPIVILSAEMPSRSEGISQSKDPYPPPRRYAVSPLSHRTPSHQALRVRVERTLLSAASGGKRHQPPPPRKSRPTLTASDRSVRPTPTNVSNTSGEEEPDRCVQQLDPYQQGDALGLRFHRESQLRSQFKKMDRFHGQLFRAGGRGF